MIDDVIRVRFAPSPTGYLHIGGLRTALFNYLFARNRNGKFILRIEDTDQSRKVEGAVENLIHTLNYMGLSFDEGPEVGGNFGPYYQSQRLDIYMKYINELIRKGHAYYAFETQGELDEMRKVQHARGVQKMYDRSARNLTEQEVKDKLSKNIPYVIRLKIPLDSEVRFDDMIRGDVRIDTNLIDDQVLMKSDGYPTYHFAHVVDDHLMKITHVIRGEEWLTSVPKHILLYNAFEWSVPQMAHVPLILNPDKSKLSKRQGDLATEDFLRKGYLKEALINYIALLGWNPGEKESREIFGFDELIRLFSIDRINSSGAIFNLEKLDWMNSEYIKSYDLNELVELSIPYLNSSGFDTSDKEKTKRVITAVRTYINKLEDLGKAARIYYESTFELTEGQKKVVENEYSKRIISCLFSKIKNCDEMSVENFKTILSETQKEIGVKGKALYQPIRLVISGEEHGPDLGLIFFVLGKNEVVNRLARYMGKQNKKNS